MNLVQEFMNQAGRRPEYLDIFEHEEKFYVYLKSTFVDIGYKTEPGSRDREDIRANLGNDCIVTGSLKYVLSTVLAAKFGIVSPSKTEFLDFVEECFVLDGWKNSESEGLGRSGSVIINDESIPVDNIDDIILTVSSPEFNGWLPIKEQNSCRIALVNLEKVSSVIDIYINDEENDEDTSGSVGDGD